jgi:cell division protein FtsL
MTPPPAAAAPAIHPRRSTVPGRPLTVAPRPRRVSGPARRPRDQRAARGAPAYTGIALGLIEGFGRLSEHRLLDRLIRGRTWIAIVAFALIGIVTLQLGLLKLNAGIGHALAREASLQRENATLSIENSELADGALVESSAARLGMEVVPAGALRFLSVNPRTDASHGAAALSARVAGSATGEASTTTSTAAPAAEAPAAQSSESQASASSQAAESEAAKTPPAEAEKASSSTEPPAERASAPASSGTAPPSETTSTSPGAEASGGTQAGTSGR